MLHIRDIYDETGWEEAVSYPQGTKIKTLRDENGAKTVLLKFPKGLHIEEHTHIYDEQHLVLEGEYESEGKVYPAGTFRLIHAKKNHGPFTSKDGAIVLVIWDPIK